MTGDDVKRQVMEGVEMLCGTSDEAETELELHFRDLLAALAPCTVLTPEEREKVLAARDALKASLDLISDGDWTPQDQHAALLVYSLDPLLTPDETGDDPFLWNETDTRSHPTR